MAREKVSNFDAEEFIESMRESAEPTYHTASDGKTKPKVEKQPVEQPPVEKPAVEKPPEEKQPMEKTSVEKQQVEKPPAKKRDRANYKVPYDDIDAKYAGMKLTAEEIDYIKTFIINPHFRSASSRGKQVLIRREHRDCILMILALLKEDANMATYIDNVLTEHFKKYYPTMVDISRKCPTTFENLQL